MLALGIREFQPELGYHFAMMSGTAPELAAENIDAEKLAVLAATFPAEAFEER